MVLPAFKQFGSHISPKIMRLTAACMKNDISKRSFPTDVAVQPADDFRTDVSNIGQQSAAHFSKFYTIAEEDRKQIFSGGGLPKHFETQIKTFAEACLMVRQPAMEILGYIQNSGLRGPATRYVLYGENGTGKSLTMAHLLHYGFQNKFILVHVPWVPNWTKRPKETSNSEVYEGLIDLPLDAAAWLLHFKTQNSKLLSELDLRTSRTYTWNKRESTAADSNLLDLVEHGINRIKYASDAIGALLSELKNHATANRCKVMVAIDGYNAFFHPLTRIRSDSKQIVPPSRITLTKLFLDITRYDWTNGVCILSVDKIGMSEGYMESYLPRYLLGKSGFEHLDPFIPVKVDNYHDKEFDNCIKYYLDRSWIQNTTKKFDEQLKFLSGGNPFTLMQLTREL